MKFQWQAVLQLTLFFEWNSFAHKSFNRISDAPQIFFKITGIKKSPNNMGIKTNNHENLIENFHYKSTKNKWS